MKFANEFLKEATRLKKEKKYLEAIKMLDKAYSVGTPGDTPPDEENPNEITDDIKYNTISTDALLRKGMYLQLAGKTFRRFEISKKFKRYVYSEI